MRIMKKGVLVLAMAIAPVALIASTAFASGISSAWAGSLGAQPNATLTAAATQLAQELAATPFAQHEPSALQFTNVEYAYTIATSEGAAVSNTGGVTPLGTPYGAGYLYGVGVVPAANGMVAVAVIFAKNPTVAAPATTSAPPASTGPSTTTTTGVAPVAASNPTTDTSAISSSSAPSPVATTTTAPAPTTTTTIPTVAASAAADNTTSRLGSLVASNTGSAVTSNPVSDFAASHAPNVGVSKNSVLWVGGALLLILALLTEYLILSRRMRRKYEKN
jgi:hypothetical protein